MSEATSSAHAGLPLHSQASQGTSAKARRLKRLLDGEDRLTVGVDLGTKETDVVWAIVPKSKSIAPHTVVSPHKILFDGNETTVPTQAAVVQDVRTQKIKLILGHKVTSMLEAHGLKSDQVFSFIKLSLLAGHEVDVLGARVDELGADKLDHLLAAKVKRAHDAAINAISGLDMTYQLPYINKKKPITPESIEDIFRAFLTWLLDCIKAHIAQVLGFLKEEIDQVMSLAHVSAACPEIWNLLMLDNYRDLLIDAGYPDVQIVSEAKCSALSVTYDKLREIIDDHDSNNELHDALERTKARLILVVDIGAGSTIH